MAFGPSQRVRATIGCLSNDTSARHTLTTALEHYGYAAAPQGAATNADIGLIDLRATILSDRQIESVISGFRQQAPEAAMVFITSPLMSVAKRAFLLRHGSAQPAGEDIQHVIAKIAQTLRLRNLAEEAGERLKSLSAVSRLADFPNIETSRAAPHVLVAGAPGRTALAASAAAHTWRGALSPGQTLRAVEYGGFDCAVFIPNDDDTLLQGLSRSLKRSPKHADFPIIHIGETVEALSDLAELGATDTLLASFIDTDLARSLRVAARRGRLAAAMRRFLTSCAGEGVKDPLSGAFSAGFFSDHLTRLGARSESTGRPLSVIIIQLYAEGDTSFDKRARHQAARLIRRIVRCEDMTARLGDDFYAVALPATNANDAQTIAERIDGVIANTLFRNAEDAIVQARIACAPSAWTPGGGVEETLAPAIASLRQERPRGPIRLLRPQSPR